MLVITRDLLLVNDCAFLLSLLLGLVTQRILRFLVGIEEARILRQPLVLSHDPRWTGTASPELLGVNDAK
jgi:hypothetical protein